MRQTTDYYPTVLLTAVVAGVFSALVSALLLVDYARRSATLPLDLPQFKARKAELARQPDNQALTAEIRAVDLRLRTEYFRQRRFAHRGAYLLFCGLAITLVAARLAATLRRRLPAPTAELAGCDPEAQVAQFGRWAVAGLIVLLAVTVVALGLGYRSPLPGSLDDVAVVTTPPPPRAGTKPADSARSAPPELPTPDEFARNWPRFRGPHGDGISAHTNVPTTWDGAAGEGILWKTPVPLPGHGSPVVWQDRVFLSGATADRREVYSFDTGTGQLLWKSAVPGTANESESPLETSEDTGYAASTTATDGRRVFAVFANGDVAALDFSGAVVWSLSLGVPKNVYGHASSLAVCGDVLIVQFDQGTAKDGMSKLLALRAATGAVAWQTGRDVPNSWASPIVAEHGGQPMIITCADPWVIAYTAADGSEIWRARCLRHDVGPSPVFAGGVVYVASEFPCLSAIDAGGRGDVTKTHVQWTADAGLPDTCGPLVAGPLVLLLASYGTLTCYDRAQGGEPLWEMDFDDSFRSSPSLVGNRVYLFGETGKSWVIEPGRTEGRQIAESDLGEPCVTSPAFQDGRIYIRGNEHLFCIGSAATRQPAASTR